MSIMRATAAESFTAASLHLGSADREGVTTPAGFGLNETPVECVEWRGGFQMTLAKRSE